MHIYFIDRERETFCTIKEGHIKSLSGNTFPKCVAHQNDFFFNANNVNRLCQQHAIAYLALKQKQRVKWLRVHVASPHFGGLLLHCWIKIRELQIHIYIKLNSRPRRLKNPASEHFTEQTDPTTAFYYNIFAALLQLAVTKKSSRNKRQRPKCRLPSSVLVN